MTRDAHNEIAFCTIAGYRLYDALYLAYRTGTGRCRLHTEEYRRYEQLK
jgi:hypothetical protein